LYLLILGGLAASCVSETEEELLRDSLIGCDTTDVSYNQDIQAILQTNCYRCHAADIAIAGVIVEGYANAKAIAETNRDGKSLLVGVTAHLPGFSQMPRNAPKLSACDIIKIKKWVAEGMKE
jgi:mono/diheme cytochrome c family protein